MIFTTLDEALTDIKSLGTWDLDHLMKHYQIACHYVDTLPDNINGYTIPDTRTCFINSKVESPLFVCHHEFTHVLLDQSTEPLIDASFVSNSKIESQANHGALYVMINNYIDKCNVDPDDFNIMHFAAAYDLDSKYILDARNIAEKILGINIFSNSFM